MDSCHYCVDLIDKLNCEYDKLNCEYYEKNSEIERLKIELEYKEFLIQMKDIMFFKLQKKLSDFVNEEEYYRYIKSGRPIKDEINTIYMIMDDEMDNDLIEELNGIITSLEDDLCKYRSKGFIVETPNDLIYNENLLEEFAFEN